MRQEIFKLTIRESCDKEEIMYFSSLLRLKDFCKNHFDVKNWQRVPIGHNYYLHSKTLHKSFIVNKFDLY